MPPRHSFWLLPKNDFVFKLLLGTDNKQSKELLIHFLNDLFQVPKGQSIPNVHLKNPHLKKEHLTNKASILDIKAQIPGMGIISIEMQLENQYNMDKRSLFYCAKLIAEQLDDGDNYKKLRKTTAINLLDFNYFNQKNYHSIYHLTERETGTPYPSILELHFIEMKEFKKMRQAGKLDKNDRLAKWIEFFSNEDDSQWRIMASKHPIIKKAVDRLEIISQDPENRHDYEIRLKTLKDMTSFKEGAREEGWLKGIAKGKAEGKIEGKLEVALEMLREGVDLNFIAKFTGLTEEQLLKLQNNLKTDH